MINIMVEKKIEVKQSGRILKINEENRRRNKDSNSMIVDSKV